jgi:lysophospholipase L1-like esterase
LTFRRYVALGDSSTEGLEDPVPGGRHRGWADRFAQHVATVQHEPLLYANLAIRGRRTRQVLDEQLPAALAMRPDLATVFSGTNDVMRSSLDLDAVSGDVRTMQRALRGAGATVLTITMPDLSDIAPMARRVKPQLEAFNERVRAICAETGTLLLDVARFPGATDIRLWHEDRLHANSEGHRRIAAGLAHTLGLPGFDGSWADALPPLRPAPLPLRAAAELRWVTRYLFPWLLRHLTKRSSGDGILPKRPQLAPVTLD